MAGRIGVYVDGHKRRSSGCRGVDVGSTLLPTVARQAINTVAATGCALFRPRGSVDVPWSSSWSMWRVHLRQQLAERPPERIVRDFFQVVKAIRHIAGLCNQWVIAVEIEHRLPETGSSAVPHLKALR